MQFRDLLAIPFVLLMFSFGMLAVTVGGVFTAEGMLEVFGRLPKLSVKDKK